MGGVFQLGAFTFSSGIRSPFKFECDDLSDDEMHAIARVGSHQVCDFGRLVPVPKGKSASPIDNAKRLAGAMQRYARPDCGVTLIVDDVWTTGGSMEACCADVMHQSAGASTVGFVIYAYQQPASWVTSFLTLSPTVGLFVQRPPNRVKPSEQCCLNFGCSNPDACNNEIGMPCGWPGTRAEWEQAN